MLDSLELDSMTDRQIACIIKGKLLHLQKVRVRQVDALADTERYISIFTQTLDVLTEDGGSLDDGDTEGAVEAGSGATCDESIMDSRHGVKCGIATVQDLEGMKFYYQGLVRIAKINGGVVDLSEAAPLLIAAKGSSSSPESVKAGLRRYIRDNGGDWIKTSRGKYQLLTVSNAQASGGLDSESKEVPIESDLLNEVLGSQLG